MVTACELDSVMFSVSTCPSSAPRSGRGTRWISPPRSAPREGWEASVPRCGRSASWVSNGGSCARARTARSPSTTSPARSTRRPSTRPSGPQPAAISFHLADPGDLVARAHDAGILWIQQVMDVEQARTAVERGVDVIIAQGSEAGGHSGFVSTMALVPQVVDVAGSSFPSRRQWLRRRPCWWPRWPSGPTGLDRRAVPRHHRGPRAPRLPRRRAAPSSHDTTTSRSYSCGTCRASPTDPPTPHRETLHAFPRRSRDAAEEAANPLRTCAPPSIEVDPATIMPPCRAPAASPRSCRRPDRALGRRGGRADPHRPADPDARADPRLTTDGNYASSATAMFSSMVCRRGCSGSTAGVSASSARRWSSTAPAASPRRRRTVPSVVSVTASSG